MNFLRNGLSGREALLIEPGKAVSHAEKASSFGMVDMLVELFGEAPKPYVLEDGTGVIPISGVIGKNLTPLEKMVGSVDVNDLIDSIDAFASDETVKRIAFDINSPGGTVTGVPEVAKRIRSVGKPTMAYTDDEMDSAAYYIGSACDRVVSSGSANVGSIGVYMVVTDVSAAYAEEGFKQVVIKSGKLKGMGIEGTSLTAEQEQNLQDGVNYIHQAFKDSVRIKRALVSDSAMEGQSFLGSQAAAEGLVTGIADTFDEALSSWE